MKTIKTFRFGDKNDVSMIFDLKFFRVLSKNRHPWNSSLYFFSQEKLALLSLFKEVQPSPDCKMLKLLTFANLFPPLQCCL